MLGASRAPETGLSRPKGDRCSCEQRLASLTVPLTIASVTCPALSCWQPCSLRPGGPYSGLKGPAGRARYVGTAAWSPFFLIPGLVQSARHTSWRAWYPSSRLYPLSCFLFQPHLAPLWRSLKIRLFSSQETVSSLVSKDLSHLSFFWALSPVIPQVRLQDFLCAVDWPTGQIFPHPRPLHTCAQHSLWDTSPHRPEPWWVENPAQSHFCTWDKVCNRNALRASASRPLQQAEPVGTGEKGAPRAPRSKLAPERGERGRCSGKERKDRSSQQGQRTPGWRGLEEPALSEREHGG